MNQCNYFIRLFARSGPLVLPVYHLENNVISWFLFPRVLVILSTSFDQSQFHVLFTARDPVEMHPIASARQVELPLSEIIKGAPRRVNEKICITAGDGEQMIGGGTIDQLVYEFVREILGSLR